VKKLFTFYLLLILVIPAVAQQTNDGDAVVSVPKKYVSAEGLTHQSTVPVPVSEWVGIGKEIGLATREGLNAVVDTAEKFGSTKVGTFVMVMIAWKIMAKEVLGVVLGIPLLLAGVGLWVWTAKRLFFGYRVLARKEGHTKIYEDHGPYDFKGNDARQVAGVFTWGTLVVWVGFMVLGVIF
jgi:hypothetical protein